MTKVVSNTISFDCGHAMTAGNGSDVAIGNGQIIATRDNGIGPRTVFHPQKNLTANEGTVANFARAVAIQYDDASANSFVPLQDRAPSRGSSAITLHNEPVALCV